MSHKVLICGVLVALFYWLFDSAVHFFLFLENSFEVIPSTFNELWMRVLICVLIITLGWYIDYARSIRAKDLQTSELNFRNLAENTPDIIWRVNIEGTLTYVSPSVKVIAGADPDEIIGLPFASLVRGAFSEDSRDDASKILRDGLAGNTKSGPMVFELTHVHRDGSEFMGELRIVPIFDQNSEIVGLQGITRDITERKRVEEELQKIEKLESIGVLAGGIAHDLNNFLTGIVGNIGLAKMYDDPAERNESLDKAERDAMRVENLTQQLLTFAKGGLPQKRNVNVTDLLKQTVNFTLSGSSIHCDCLMRPDTLPVYIDDGQIRQVINNLVINAQQAMPEGGTIRVSAMNVELGREDGIPLDDGPYVKISVEDEGMGIGEDDRKRVFDPFFTTKPTGNGLGLAASYSIVKNHDGLITVDSELSVGSRFDIYLPASTEDVRYQEESKTADSITGGNRILVMDDQQNVRDLLAEILRTLECEVITSADGVEAIEKYKDSFELGSPFNAVILDLTIPGGMGGGETISKLREIDPGVSAIVASGYSDDPIMTGYRDYGFKGAISKPYGIQGLRQVLSEVLNE